MTPHWHIVSLSMSDDENTVLSRESFPFAQLPEALECLAAKLRHAKVNGGRYELRNRFDRRLVGGQYLSENS